MYEVNRNKLHLAGKLWLTWSSIVHTGKLFYTEKRKQLSILIFTVCVQITQVMLSHEQLFTYRSLGTRPPHTGSPCKISKNMLTVPETIWRQWIDSWAQWVLFETSLIELYSFILCFHVIHYWVLYWIVIYDEIKGCQNILTIHYLLRSQIWFRWMQILLLQRKSVDEQDWLHDSMPEITRVTWVENTNKLIGQHWSFCLHDHYSA